MANANTPSGLQPVNETGIPWSGMMMLVNFPATQLTNIFKGDPVVSLGGSDAFGVPQVGLASAGAGNPVLGSFMGISNGPQGSNFTVTRDLPIYRQAAASNYGLIAPWDQCFFAIQEDSVGGAIAAAVGAGANGNLVAGAGNTVTGYSGWQLQSSSVAAAANPTYQLRLVGLIRGPDNALGVNAKWLTVLNNPQLTSNVGV